VTKLPSFSLPIHITLLECADTKRCLRLLHLSQGVGPLLLHIRPSEAYSRQMTASWAGCLPFIVRSSRKNISHTCNRRYGLVVDDLDSAKGAE